MDLVILFSSNEMQSTYRHDVQRNGTELLLRRHSPKIRMYIKAAEEREIIKYIYEPDL